MKLGVWCKAIPLKQRTRHDGRCVVPKERNANTRAKLDQMKRGRKDAGFKELYAEMKKVTAKNARVRKAVTTMRKGLCPYLQHVLIFHPQEQISHPIPLGREACLDSRERVFQVTTGEGRGPLNRQIFHG